MTKQDWIKDLKSKMSDYQAPVPETLWDDIEASLPQAMPGGRHALMRPWRKWSVAAAIALALLGGGAYLWQQYGVGSPSSMAIAEEQALSPVDNEQLNVVEDVADSHLAASAVAEASDNDSRMPTDAATVISRQSSTSSSAIPPRKQLIAMAGQPSTTSSPSSAAQSASTVQPSSTDHPVPTPQADDEKLAGTTDKPETNAPKPETSAAKPQPHRTPHNDGFLPSLSDLPVTTAQKGRAPMAIGLYASNDAFSFSNSAPVIDYAMANGAMFDSNESYSLSSLRLSGYEEKTRHHHPISMLGVYQDEV